MKIILITILFLSQVIAFNCQAQYEDDINDVTSVDTLLKPYLEPKHHSITALEFYYSSKVFNNQFYNSFNQLDHINFNQPLPEIGIGLSGRITTTGKSYLQLLEVDASNKVNLETNNITSNSGNLTFDKKIKIWK